MFVLFNFIIMQAISAFEAIAGSTGVVRFIYSLAVLIPPITVDPGRLRKTGLNGLRMRIVFVLLIGFWGLVYFLVLDSDSGSNQYGSNPKVEF